MVNGGHILKTESGTPVRTRKTFTQKLDTQGVAGYVFILPFIIGFLSFLLVPMIMSLVYSFTEYDILKEPTFIGAANYVDMLHKQCKVLGCASGNFVLCGVFCAA
jgi:multiple sugar transport system permease protein